MDSFKQQYGPWALVTGASSGIGEAFAKSLAQRGLNLILVARRSDRLSALAADLTRRFGIEAVALACDLANPQAWDSLLQEVAPYEIGLLVNNAGMATNGPVHKTTLDKQLQLVALNVTAPLVLSHQLGAKMVQRRRGGIIQVGSQSSFFAVPYLTTYSASKAWLLHLGLGLSFEWRKLNVHAQVLCPGYTDTEMTAKLKGKVRMMTPEFVVEKSLNNLGKKDVVTPSFQDWLQVLFFNLLMSRQVAARFIGKTMER